MVKIYYLEKENQPFYIGKSKNPIRRKHKHYIKYGNDIGLEIIDEVPENEWKFWESYWIEQFKVWGFKLVNKNKGGGGPEKYNEEQKQKMRGPRPGTGKKISETLKERNHSKYYTKSVRQKISRANKGSKKPFTLEHKQNMAKAKLLNGKVVECFDLQDNKLNEFKCLREAQEWLLNIKPTISLNVGKQIKDCCVGRQKTCHGYRWKYKNG